AGEIELVAEDPPLDQHRRVALHEVVGLVGDLALALAIRGLQPLGGVEEREWRQLGRERRGQPDEEQSDEERSKRSGVEQARTKQAGAQHGNLRDPWTPRPNAERGALVPAELYRSRMNGSGGVPARFIRACLGSGRVRKTGRS